MKIHYTLLPILAIAYSCTESFDLELDAEPKLIIDARIDNLTGPNYVRIGLSQTNFDGERYWYGYDSIIFISRFEYVDDALVIISDDCGTVDTLVPASDSILRYTYDYTEIFDSTIMNYRMITTRGDSAYYKSDYPELGGYYQTTKINQGKPEHTYYLRVEWHGKVYTSECTMPKSFKVDSITYRESDKYDDGNDGLIGLLWFKDNPSECNYYMFVPWSYSSGTIWERTILDDRNMKSDINGVDAFCGISVAGFERSSVVANMDRFFVYSITKETYNYYNTLIQQLRYDGGIYTPAPASPVTNIKGGAFGLFNVSYVVEIDTRLSEWSKY